MFTRDRYIFDFWKSYGSEDEFRNRKWFYQKPQKTKSELSITVQTCPIVFWRRVLYRVSYDFYQNRKKIFQKLINKNRSISWCLYKKTFLYEIASKTSICTTLKFAPKIVSCILWSKLATEHFLSKMCPSGTHLKVLSVKSRQCCV